MVKRKVDEKIVKIVEDYVKEVSKYYAIDAVYLYGSYAAGNPRFDSDIDVAIISKDIRDRIDDMGKMFALTWDIDTRIEPYPINTKDFNTDNNLIINEIKSTGLNLFSA